ncbi:MAG: hypothetical protein EHM49_01225 [Deltaproteobacteria bacterium]|nr:MAG: hypothetical protein EHM49_07985 [Deltaproteobacteria bacterium]RPI55980.1 MAG: hypothetical protein EHM49_01225 [Deltaproteobacteria bacterium]
MKLIVEAAKSHGGEVKKARKIIMEAANAGAYAVKFQYYTLKDLNPKHQNYMRNKNCHLTLDELAQLKTLAGELGIKMWCSAFNPKDMKPLSGIFDAVKIPSTFLWWDEMFVEAFKHFRIVFYSDGMASGEEAADACSRIMNLIDELNMPTCFKSRVLRLSCVSEYPAGSACLRRLNGHSGLSYHGENKLVLAMAVALGLEYIELHYDPWKPSIAKEIITSAQNEMVGDNEARQGTFNFYKEEFKGLRAHKGYSFSK